MITATDAFAAARAAMRGPFVRGVRDCLFAACAASEALCGRNPLASGAPQYRTMMGAVRIAARAGGFVAWADQTFRASGMVAGGVAGPGDLVMIEDDRASRRFVFGLCIKPGEFATKGEGGMVIIAGEPVGVWSWV